MRSHVRCAMIQWQFSLCHFQGFPYALCGRIQSLCLNVIHEWLCEWVGWVSMDEWGWVLTLVSPGAIPCSVMNSIVSSKKEEEETIQTVGGRGEQEGKERTWMQSKQQWAILSAQWQCESRNSGSSRWTFKLQRAPAVPIPYSWV